MALHQSRYRGSSRLLPPVYSARSCESRACRVAVASKPGTVNSPSTVDAHTCAPHRRFLITKWLVLENNFVSTRIAKHSFWRAVFLAPFFYGSCVIVQLALRPFVLTAADNQQPCTLLRQHLLLIVLLSLPSSTQNLHHTHSFAQHLSVPCSAY